ADQKSYYEQTRIERDSLQKAVAAELPSDFADEVEAHFDFMPDNYFRASKVPDIVHDLRLFRSFFENASIEQNRPLVPAISWEAFPQFGHSTAAICTWDRQDLLAKIAGSFSVVPLNILSADIFPREDHTILALFRVCDMRERAVSETS